jgi:hypothetical protein
MIQINGQRVVDCLAAQSVTLDETGAISSHDQ